MKKIKILLAACTLMSSMLLSGPSAWAGGKPHPKPGPIAPDGNPVPPMMPGSPEPAPVPNLPPPGSN
ncbi:MAG TPA: hypothetical protein VG759_26430 [Candidatus Angelobacter sp.]|jgi:hypothetical protein|nr:hypothetical protein [Candidatus Angelobacter sp.]